MKEKNRQSIDSKRKAEERNIEIGDKVLVKHDREDKLSTSFAQELHIVVDKLGSQITVQG